MFKKQMDDYTFMSVVLSKGATYSSDGYVEDLFLGYVMNMLSCKGYEVTDMLEGVILIVGDKFVEFGVYEGSEGLEFYMEQLDTYEVNDILNNPEDVEDINIEFLDFKMNYYLYEIGLDRYRSLSRD